MFIGGRTDGQIGTYTMYDQTETYTKMYKYIQSAGRIGDRIEGQTDK